tara:strand:+ start:1107 stop:1988 length:882 start_codon:yes stop_codon:yes gene_type:complete
MNINTLINRNKSKFDTFYKNLLNKKLKNSHLEKAMKYASMNGGKRIRPFLVSESSRIANLSDKNMLIVSSSIELIHSYSLIHDDLPSMDNDDFRRGKPSTHKKFDEATAILAGDALHDLAFEILSKNLYNINPDTNLKLLNYMTVCTGFKGLAGGQSLDLLFENKKFGITKIIDMYKKKTGKLFEFCFASPFILKEFPKEKIIFSKNFGIIYGMIFQIIDDLIDEINNFKLLGKTPGKDIKQGKRTLHSIIGKKKITNYCKNIVNKFIEDNKKEFINNPRLEKILFYNIRKLD